MSREPIITERPRSLPSATPRIKTGCGWLYIIHSTDLSCFEVSFELGKTGCCSRAFLETLSRLVTLARRQVNPLPRSLIIKSLDGIRCPLDNGFTPSCPQAIANFLTELWGMSEN